MKRYFWYEIGWWAMVFVLAAIVVMSAASLAWSQEPSREQFFKDAKKARLANGKTVDCCDPAEVIGVRVNGSQGDYIVGEATQLFRHKNVKLGQVLKVDKKNIVVWPVPPSDMGDLMFVESTFGKHVYCFFPQTQF